MSATEITTIVVEQGPRGPKGDIQWRGPWDSTVDYAKGESVFHNGTSWVAESDPAVGDEPGVVAETTWRKLIAEDQQPKFMRDVVADDGATGDGTTDDTPAIKSAVDAVGEAGGGIVFFPPGTYLMGMVRVEHPNVHIVGAGRGATTLLMAADGGSTITFGHFDDTSVRGTVEHVSIRSLTVDGNKSAHSTDDGNPGLTTEDVVDCLFFDLRVVDTAGYGIGIVNTDAAHRDEIKLSHVDILRPNQDGVDIKPGLPTFYAEHVRVRDAGPVSGHASTGFDLRVSNYAHLAYCIAENCDTHGFEAAEEPGGEYVFVGCRAENTTVGEGFRINAGDATFAVCYAINNRAGFLANSAGSSHFDRCVAYDNAEAGIDAEANGTVGEDRVGIDGCEVYDNATGEDGRGILIGDVAKWRVANTIIRPGPNANQERGIQFTGDAPAGVLVGIDAQGHATADVVNRPSGTAAAANLIGTES